MASSAVFSGGAGGARAFPEFGGSEKGKSLISAYWSLAIITNTPGFKKLNTLGCQIDEYTLLFGTKETRRKKQTQRQTKVFNKNPL